MSQYMQALTILVFGAQEPQKESTFLCTDKKVPAWCVVHPNDVAGPYYYINKIGRRVECYQTLEMHLRS